MSSRSEMGRVVSSTQNQSESPLRVVRNTRRPQRLLRALRRIVSTRMCCMRCHLLHHALRISPCCPAAPAAAQLAVPTMRACEPHSRAQHGIGVIVTIRQPRTLDRSAINKKGRAAFLPSPAARWSVQSTAGARLGLRRPPLPTTHWSRNCARSERSSRLRSWSVPRSCTSFSLFL